MGANKANNLCCAFDRYYARTVDSTVSRVSRNGKQYSGMNAFCIDKLRIIEQGIFQ